MNRYWDDEGRLALCKGEGRVRDYFQVVDALSLTPHLHPLPFSKGRGERGHVNEQSPSARANAESQRRQGFFRLGWRKFPIEVREIFVCQIDLD